MKRIYLLKFTSLFANHRQMSLENTRMKYFRIKKLFFVTTSLFLIFLINSCEKSLDLVPKTTFSESTFFKTVDQYKLFANQFYLQLPVTGFDVTREVYADLMTGSSRNTVSNGSYPAPPTNPVWEDSYSLIRNTTYLIGQGNEAADNLKDEVSIYVGEAKFFRALAYFNLIRDFGGVPIIDKVLTLDDDDLLYGPRNSREEVVNYIMNDLDDAISVLPAESDISESDKGRVSKAAALSLKARIALFESTWRKFRSMDGFESLLDKAINSSDQVISSGEYELFDRRDVLGDESYRYFFILDHKQSNPANLTKADQHEYILVNRYDENFRSTPTRGSNNISTNPTKKFADMFLCTDGLPIDKSPLFQGKQTISSEYENRDLRMKNIFVLPYSQFWESGNTFFVRDWSDPFAGGYPDIPFGANVVDFSIHTRTGYMERKANPEIFHPSLDFPVIRLAEVLLINAEALYEKNGSITDDQLNSTINKLRARAGVADLTNDFVASNGLDMRTEIRRERNVELFKEGQRFDDLRRWKTAEIEMPRALKGVLWKGTQYESDPQYEGVVYPYDEEGNIIIEDASKRSFEQKNYLFPLPTRQLLLNPQLEQNPGW